MYYPYEKLFSIKQNKNFSIDFLFNGKKMKLVPVKGTDEEIFKIGSWREKFYDAFPSKFYVSFAGTKNWLINQVIENEDRLLLIIKEDEKILGHLGYYRFNQKENSCEIDNVVKGVEDYKGLMSLALEKVIIFAFEELKMSYLTLRVFNDNEKAKRLYKRCGFEEKRLIPLAKKYNSENCYSWIETDDKHAERYFCEMILKR